MVVGVLVVCTPVWARQMPGETYKGRPLEDVLRAFQAQGLPIVFTSSVVTPDVRVKVEPRGGSKRRQLDEILVANGLEARDGAGGTIQIVRLRTRATGLEQPRMVLSTGTIEGRVIHGVSGIALPDAIVRTDDGARLVRTDAAGRFVIRRVAEGARTIRAFMEGFAPVECEVQVMAGATLSVMLIFDPAAGRHTEHLIVTETAPHRRDPGVAAEATLDWRQWQDVPPAALDHPMRMVHALPRVTALDDFRSEFTVRGSALRHIGLVIDGVPAPWLKHSAGQGAKASLSMLTGHAIEEATLRAGAYPRRHGDRLGAELELSVREGSRDQFNLRGAVGGPNATVLAEGPLGKSGRGSWLIAGRQSYLEWPDQISENDSTAFGFSDGMAKVVYDVTRGQQLALTVLGGQSVVDAEEELFPESTGDGVAQASIVNLAWQSRLGAASVLNQRVYTARHWFEEAPQDDVPGDRTFGAEAGYRADLTAALAAGVLEAGMQFSRGIQRNSTVDPHQQAAYMHFMWSPVPTWTIAPGLRVTNSTQLASPTLSRWILGEWAFRPRWLLSGSAGVTHQDPDLQRFDSASPAARYAERATHFDMAIEQRLGRSVRWQATVFRRTEAGLQAPDDFPLALGDERVMHTSSGGSASARRGAARGIELLIDFQPARGFSGWAAYSYGKVQSSDLERHETYWADFDQRHGFNASGAYRFSDRTAAGATFRAGSNFPIPGYLAGRDGSLFVATRRNQVRLPAYARLDLNAHRRFEYRGRRLTLFAELLNVMNRTNVGLANGEVRPTGEAVGFTTTLMPRRATAGLVIEF